MKKLIRLVREHELNEITLPELKGNEIIAYIQDSGVNMSILGTLKREYNETKYGFVPLNRSDSAATFVSNTWIGAIQNALFQRKVYVFENQIDLAKFILNGEV